MHVVNNKTPGSNVDTNAAVTADIDAAISADPNLRLMGYSCRESAGAPAVAGFQIVNGATGNAANKVVEQELAANESNTEWFGPDGIECPLGISVNFLAGEFDVDLFYKIIS